MQERVVLLTDSDIPGSAAEDALREAGFAVKKSPVGAPAAYGDDAAEVEALVVQWAPISGDVMDSFPRLRLISRLGIGYDMIDVEAATARGIAVANTPSYCVEEVAAHSIAMIMSLSRGLPHYDRTMRKQLWQPVAAYPMAARPSTTTVAVVGFGRIGSKVAVGLKTLGFRVLVIDPFASKESVAGAGCEPVELAEALSESDIVSLHVPLDDQTRHMLRPETIATMKKGAVVVNTCRGGLIDETALIDALRSGQLGAAALDVFEQEPLSSDHPFLQQENVLISPHAAWYSPESLRDLPVHAAQNVIDFFAQGDAAVPIVNRSFRDQAEQASVNE